MGDTNATVGEHYTYTAVAPDADHDQITYSLGLAPAGMVIDPTLGVIDWTPTASEVGFQNVDIRANDGNGNIATQYYTILVSPADVPPVITTTAPTPASWRAYTYLPGRCGFPREIHIQLRPGRRTATGMGITPAGS